MVSSSRFSSARVSGSVAAPKDARVVFRVHLGRHGGKGENPFHSQLACKFDQGATERVLTARRLRFTDEDDDVALLLWVVPDEKAAAGHPPAADQTTFDLHVFDIEKLVR